MTARILDGKKLSAEIRASIKQETALLREKGIVPGLAVVLVGDDPASKVYVGQKEKGVSRRDSRLSSTGCRHQPPRNSSSTLSAGSTGMPSSMEFSSSSPCRPRSTLTPSSRRYGLKRTWTVFTP